MTFFNRLLVALLTVGLLSSCSTTTVYIVRHGEKVAETDSTDLSPAGKQRALTLADTLARRGIDSVFSTPYRRTRQTAQPLASRLGLPVMPYQKTDAIVSRVGVMRNKTALIVGHSNTILDIAKGLGANPTKQRIESNDHANLLVVRIRRGPFSRSVTLGEETYGQPPTP